MKYLCVNCNYIFDEAFGDKTEGIQAGTKIEEIEMCPVCEEYDSFNHIDEEIIYMDEETMDKYELAHYIDAEVNDGTIKVVIGQDNHPMAEEHRICWIGLYDEYGDLITEEFLGVDNSRIVEFDDEGIDNFEVRIKCNQHNLFARKFALLK